MANPYITLTDSAEQISKKFVVIFSGYEPLLDKVQTVNTTINGGLDAAFGGVYETHTYTIKIRETEPRAGYGSKADLESLFRLNNPNGTPSTVITLTDHYGNYHEVLMVGQYLPTPLSIMIEGDQAWMIVKCTFRFIPVPTEQGSGS